MASRGGRGALAAAAFLACCAAPGAGVEGPMMGSYDSCPLAVTPADMNWTAVCETINEHLAVGLTPEKLSHMQTMAMVDQDVSRDDFQGHTCWLGVLSIRFFGFLTISAEELRAMVVEGRVRHQTEWTLWLGAPWYDLVLGTWSVHSVLHAMARALSPLWKQINDADLECSQRELELHAKLRAFGAYGGAGSGDEEADASARAAAARDYLAAELSHSVATVRPGDPGWELDTGETPRAGWTVCRGHAVTAAFLQLGLAPPRHRHHVTPGYALARAQWALRLSVDSGLVLYLISPFRIAEDLANLVLLIREQERRLAANAEAPSQALAAAVREAQMEFPGETTEFLPVLTRRERLQLLDGLRATHLLFNTLGVRYAMLSGTLLGAARHHGFIPWDGDADVCVDQEQEPILLQAALAQSGGGGGNAAVDAAMGLLRDLGFALHAQSTKALTFKLSPLSGQTIVGRDHRYPYVDIWFCHGWRDGSFLMLQSANFGVRIARRTALPLRKVFFAGLALWSFRGVSEVLDAYYRKDWYSLCHGHKLFHREERQYRADKDEAVHTKGITQCSMLARSYAFAELPAPGLPDGISTAALAGRLAAFFRHAGLSKPRWTVKDFDAAGRGLPRRVAADPPLWPFDGGGLGPVSASSSRLLHPAKTQAEPPLATRRRRSVHHVLVDALVEPAGLQPAEPTSGPPRVPHCALILRLVPQALNTHSGAGLEPADAADLGGYASVRSDQALLQSAEGPVHRMEVVSCVCQQSMAGLALQWVQEDDLAGSSLGHG